MLSTDSNSLMSELALSADEIDYGLLFDNVASAFAYCKMLFDGNGNPVDFIYLQVNSLIEKLFKMNRSDIIGKKSSEVTPNAIIDHPELLKTLGRVALTGKSEELELFIDSVNIWLYVSIFSPKKNYFIFIFENITKLKNYEVELKHGLERFSDLANSLPELVFEVDLTGRLIYLNQIGFETTGFTQEDLDKGYINTDLYAPEYIEKAKIDFTKVIANSATIINEYVLRRKDGTKFDAIIKAAPIKSGDKAVGIKGIVIDITEQKKATEALVFQSQLLEAVGQALIAIDKKGMILYWNKAAKNLYGWTAQEVLGKNINGFLNDGSSRDQIDRISNNQNSGENWFGETQVRNRNGNMIPVIITRTPVFNKAGELIGSINVYTDISDQKSIELELKSYVEEYAVATDKIENLNEKLRVISGLARNDIRNKLAALDGYMYLLKKKMADSESAKYLAKMDEASKQLQAILEFERVYEQIGSEKLGYVNVEKFFAESCALVSDFKGVNLECKCDGLEVFADSLLHQLLYHLMDNTLKYGEKATLIKLRCKKDANSMQLIYEDDGMGLTDEVRLHLFEKGFGKGTGLGLYMIKRIIEAYGWIIEENGKLGVGARFTMKIPENKFILKENI